MMAKNGRFTSDSLKKRWAEHREPTDRDGNEWVSPREGAQLAGVCVGTYRAYMKYGTCWLPDHARPKQKRVSVHGCYCNYSLKKDAETIGTNRLSVCLNPKEVGYLTPAQTAKLLKISVTSLQKPRYLALPRHRLPRYIQRKKGKGKAKTRCDLIRFLKTDVDDFIKKHSMPEGMESVGEAAKELKLKRGTVAGFCRKSCRYLGGEKMKGEKWFILGGTRPELIVSIQDRKSIGVAIDALEAGSQYTADYCSAEEIAQLYGVSRKYLCRDHSRFDLPAPVQLPRLKRSRGTLTAHYEPYFKKTDLKAAKPFRRAAAVARITPRPVAAIMTGDNPQPGYLGLIVDQTEKTISANGKTLDLSNNRVSWHIFSVCHAVEGKQVSLKEYLRNYPGELSARYSAVTAINKLLSRFNVKISERRLVAASP